MYNISGTVCLGVYKRQESLAVGTILASLSVRTTAGLFHVGGRDLGVLEAESLALLFVLVVLVDVAPCVAFPGPGNIYKPAIAFWSMQARPAQAVQQR